MCPVLPGPCLRRPSPHRPAPSDHGKDALLHQGRVWRSRPRGWRPAWSLVALCSGHASCPLPLLVASCPVEPGPLGVPEPEDHPASGATCQLHSILPASCCPRPVPGSVSVPSADVPSSPTPWPLRPTHAQCPGLPDAPTLATAVPLEVTSTRKTPALPVWISSSGGHTLTTVPSGAGVRSEPSLILGTSPARGTEPRWRKQEVRRGLSADRSRRAGWEGRGLAGCVPGDTRSCADVSAAQGENLCVPDGAQLPEETPHGPSQN